MQSIIPTVIPFVKAPFRRIRGGESRGGVEANSGARANRGNRVNSSLSSGLKKSNNGSGCGLDMSQFSVVVAFQRSVVVGWVTCFVSTPAGPGR